MIITRIEHQEGISRFLVLGFWCLVLLALAVALAVLPLPVAVLLVGSAAAFVLALIDPFWGVCWAVLSVPVQEVVRLPGGVTVTQAVLLLAIAVWGLRVLAYPQHRVRFGSLGLPLVLLLGALAISSVFSPYSPFEGFKETLRWTWVLLVYVIVVNQVTDRRRATLLLGCLLLAPTADALLGLWQFITATGPPSFGIAGGRFMRAYGTIGQPNSFAGYMNMALPLALALTVGLWQKNDSHGTKHTQRAPLGVLLFCACSTLILLAALCASFSRGGWVGALGGALALALAFLARPGQQRTHDHGRPQQRRWTQVLVLAAAGGVLAVSFAATGLLPSSVAARFDSITANLRLFDVRSVNVTPENFAVVERMAHIQAGWGMFITYPLLGVGPGNFTLAYPTFAIPPWYISQGHAHNYYLHMAAEAGIIGAVLYLVLLGTSVRQVLRMLRHTHDPFWLRIVFGACGMIAAVMVHNLFENLHVLNLPLQLGAVWGLIAVADRGPGTDDG